MTNDVFISNILIVEAITKYEMLRYNVSYKQVTRNIYLDNVPQTVNGQGNFFNFAIKFFSNDHLQAFICRRGL